MELGESKEDYLEAIYVLKHQKGYVRNTMLCDYMNYSKASISVAMRVLCKDGYVERDEKGRIELTEKGEQIAEKIYARHKLIKGILMGIGVSPETANQDACRMEHAISEETFQQLQKLVMLMKESN